MNAINQLPSTGAGRNAALTAKDQVNLKNALGDFEAIFIGQMLTSMRQTVPTSKVMGENGHGEKLFRDMMDSEYAKLLSKRENGQGIKEMLYQQLSLRMGQATSGVEDAVSRLKKQGSDAQAAGYKTSSPSSGVTAGKGGGA